MTTQILRNKANEQTTEMLINVVKGLENNLTDSADLVFDIALDILMERLSEEDFELLCEEL